MAADITTRPATWMKTSGGYGRPATALYGPAAGTEWTMVAILVTMPKAFVDHTGFRYMVTDRRPGARYSDPTVTTTWDFVKRADAVKHAETLLTR